MSRTNNFCNWFHKKLNDIFDGYHPKTPYLLYKLKDSSLDLYNKYKIEKTVYIQEKNKEIINGIEIFNFLKSYKNKYKCHP